MEPNLLARGDENKQRGSAVRQNPLSWCDDRVQWWAETTGGKRKPVVSLPQLDVVRRLRRITDDRARMSKMLLPKSVIAITDSPHSRAHLLRLSRLPRRHAPWSLFPRRATAVLSGLRQIAYGVCLDVVRAAIATCAGTSPTAQVVGAENGDSQNSRETLDTGPPHGNRSAFPNHPSPLTALNSPRPPSPTVRQWRTVPAGR